MKQLRIYAATQDYQRNGDAQVLARTRRHGTLTHSLDITQTVRDVLGDFKAPPIFCCCISGILILEVDKCDFMVTLETSLDLDSVKTEISSIVKDGDGLSYSKEEYWDNEKLYPNNSKVPNGSKVKFYLEQAEKQGSLENIQTHFDPLSFYVRASATISTGMIGSHTHYVRFKCWDLSRIRMIAQGAEVSLGTGPQTIELWPSVCSEDHATATDYRDKIEKEIENQI